MASSIEERLKEKLQLLREKQSKDNLLHDGRKLAPLEQRIQQYKAKLNRGNKESGKSSKQSSQNKDRTKGIKINDSHGIHPSQAPSANRPASATSRSRGPDDSTAPSPTQPKKPRNTLGKRTQEASKLDSSSAEPSAAGATETASTPYVVPRDSDAAPPPEMSEAGDTPPGEPWGPGRNPSRCMNSKTTVFVGDLPMFLTSRELYEHLQAYGEVACARVMGSMCYGFAEFKDPETCDKALLAIESKPLVVNGEPLRVMRARGGMPQWQQGPAIIKPTGLMMPFGLESYEHPTAKKARYGFRELVKDSMLRQELEGADVPKGRKVIAYDDI